MSNGKGFKRQLLEMASGSTIAQALSLLLMPVITRLYLPVELGEYAIYAAVSSIAGLIVNLRLDLTLVIAKSDEEAQQLSWLGIFSSAAGGLIVFFAMALWVGPNLLAVMTALSTFATGTIQILANWLSRKQLYTQLASRYAFEKLTVLIASIGFGLWGFTQWGLVVGQTLGLFFALTYMAWICRLPIRELSPRGWLALGQRFSDFPGKNVLSSIFFTMSVFLPSIFLERFFGKEELGHYNLASRMFDAPVLLIGYSFYTVYYQHSARQEGAERLPLFWKSLRLLFIIFVPAMLGAGLAGPYLFPLVFGPNWTSAGQLAPWLALYSAIRLLFVSQWPLLMVQRRLGLELILMALLFVSQLGGLFLGAHFTGDLVKTVICMAMLGCLVHLGGLILIQRILKKSDTLFRDQSIV